VVGTSTATSTSTSAWDSAFIGTPQMTPQMTLLIPHLAMRSIYTQENMLFFVSVAHSDSDLVALEEAVKDSLLTMRKGGYFA
jgi:hypothetical protein